MGRLGIAAAFLLFLGEAAAAPPSAGETARAADELLGRTYAADGPGAAVLVARGDTILYRGARGLGDIAGRVPLRPESLFRIGSVTKQIAAAGLLTLVDAGQVRLDDPLSKYLPDYPGGQRITILQLLNHTSGVRSYTTLRDYVTTGLEKDVTTAELVDIFDDQPPEFAPGARWAYNNSGYVLVGAVIESVTGLPWYVFLERRLFQPLGMTNTGWGHDPAFAARQVRGYSFRGGKLAPPQMISMTQPHAAAGLVSNVDDLFKWNRALHGGRVLSPATYAKMITPVGAAAARGYAFGLFQGRLRRAYALSHGGAIFGFRASLRYLPAADLTVIVLENEDATPRGEAEADALARRLAALAIGDPYPDAQPFPLGAETLREAEGLYRFGPTSFRVLRVVDGQLTHRRERGRRTTLTPIAPDELLTEDGFTRIVLERTAGRITQLRFFPAGDGDGQLSIRTNEALP